MIKWLIRVLWGCSGCKFKPVRDGVIVSSSKAEIPSGHFYIARCETCGRMKQWDFH